MADEDKQFDATPQKLKKARDQGQVVKSKDFSMAIAILVMWIAIFQFAPFIWQQISGLFITLYEQIPNKTLEEIGYAQILFKTILPTAIILAPLLILASFIAIVGDLIQVGPLFTMTPLEPKLDKLNPTKYFKNLMSVKTMFELVKNIVKVVLLGIIGFVVQSSFSSSSYACSNRQQFCSNDRIWETCFRLYYESWYSIFNNRSS